MNANSGAQQMQFEIQGEDSKCEAMRLELSAMPLVKTCHILDVKNESLQV